MSEGSAREIWGLVMFSSMGCLHVFSLGTSNVIMCLGIYTFSYVYYTSVKRFSKKHLGLLVYVDSSSLTLGI